MTLAEPPCPDPVDAQAQTIAAAGVVGADLSYQQACWELASLIYPHSVFRAAAAAYLTTIRSHRQEVDDLADRLRMLVVSKLTEPSSTSGYDLRRTAGGESLIGWARGFSMTAARSEHRNLRTWRRNQGDLCGPESDEGANTRWVEILASRGRLVGSSSDPVQESGGIPGDSDRMVEVCARNEIADVHFDRVRGLRGVARLCEEARTLVEFYGLPSVRRPTNPADRERLRDVVSADQHAAFRSAAWLLDQMRVPHAAPGTSITWSGDRVAVTPRVNPNLSVDDDLVSLWSGYRSTDLGQLTQVGAGVAHKLALAALSPRPAPQQKVVAAVAAAAADLSEEPGWGELAHDAVAAWAGAQGEITSEFSTNPAAPKSAEALREDTRRWRATARAVASFDGSPLGGTVGEVESALIARADAIATDLARGAGASRGYRVGAGRSASDAG